MALTNSQYEAIMHGYELNRLEHQREQADRQAYVFEHVPGFKELEDSISQVSISYARESLMHGHKLDKQGLRDKIFEISSRKLALLREAGLPEDYLDMQYTCPDCKDTGYIAGQKCHCLKQKIINNLYEQSNLQKLTETANFSLLSDSYYTGEDLKRFLGAVDTCKNFINNFDTDYQNIFFYGTVGTGKSFLSICVAKEILDRGHSVIYFSSSALFEKLSEYAFDYNNKNELHNLYEDLYNCELLIIDDLGTERTNSFVTSQFFSCLNERKLRNRSTIINSNLDLEGLRNLYSDRIFSRIASDYSLVKLTGPDIRIYKKTLKNRK
ncbi:MAG: DNA replication protein DnaC [Butyrivibrio sp.]|nr:DNA replication protein DnaC [Butyrivibrio sp.]MBQ7429562.1 ATP-binding protein [Butyrivibrio sp.]MCR4832050.1 ATP-binding protein [Butyrivibrio sp.]